MNYEMRVIAPANTAKASPREVEFEVHPGTINQVEVEFPSGCAGLVHVQILRWERILWPSGVEQTFTGDGSHIVFGESYRLLQLPFTIKVRVWNLDDTFSHTPIVRMGITPVEEMSLLDRIVGAFATPFQDLG